MKVLEHAKRQGAKSHQALLAHALMAETLIRAQQAFDHAARAKRKQLEDALGLQQMHGWLAAIERPMYWRLNADHTVSPVRGKLANGSADALAWAMEFGRDNRQIADTMVEGRRVSTIFLGLDHGFSRSGPPILFETMVFSETVETNELLEREYHETLNMRRYATYAEAMKGHEELVAETRAIVAQMNRTIQGDGKE